MMSTDPDLVYCVDGVHALTLEHLVRVATVRLTPGGWCVLVDRFPGRSSDAHRQAVRSFLGTRSDPMVDAVDGELHTVRSCRDAFESEAYEPVTVEPIPGTDRVAVAARKP